MIGITAYGSYVPRLRLSRSSVIEANAWFTPGLAGKGKGTRAMANWDEDALTMAVAAARDCLGTGDDRSHIDSVILTSCTLPFAERLNAGVLCEALTLDDQTRAADITGTQRAALSGIVQAVAQVKSGGKGTLVVASDIRKTRAGSTQELDFGDGSAAVQIGSGDQVLAEFLAGTAVTVDFVDHFREAGEEIDYYWEERWVRDEGISKIAPRAISQALSAAGVSPSEVDHLIFPSTFAKMDAQLAKRCGIRADAVADSMAATVGDTGVPHALLMLAGVLERASAGQIIVLAQFASGAEAVVLRVTDAISKFRPAKGLSTWVARGVPESSYTKFLWFKGQLEFERGMRGEQDRKTALSTAFRHRAAILGLVAGRSEATGNVHFPPSRISIAQGGQAEAEQDTQHPHKLAERRAHVLSWSAEFLSFHRSPPHTYGQVDFDGGGRILMEFTDVSAGDIDTGVEVEMTFRIKDVDDRRGYTRYFWKATPVVSSSTSKEN